MLFTSEVSLLRELKCAAGLMWVYELDFNLWFIACILYMHSVSCKVMRNVFCTNLYLLSTSQSPLLRRSEAILTLLVPLLPPWGSSVSPREITAVFSEGKRFLPLYFKHAASLSLYELHISLQPYIHCPASLTSRQVLPLFMNPLYHLLTDSLTAGLAE